MKNKLLSKITSEQLIQDFKQLGSSYKIAKKYNINVVTVYSAFKIINYNCRLKQDVSSIVSKEILQDAYKRLGTLKTVGRELKINYDSVKKYMKQFDLKFNKQIRYDVNHNFFSQDTEESFYIAGFIAADGCVKYKNNSYILYIDLAKKDKNLLNNIKNILNANNPIHDFLVKN